MATATNGSFHDANSADQLPKIFETELGGLQSLAIRDLSICLQRLEF